MKVLEVIRRPIVTEKSTILASAFNQYVFEVEKTANKFQIKEAVELAFDVSVTSVRTLTVPGKMRRVGNGPQADIKPGNALPLSAIPTGTLVHNIEMTAGRGAQMVRTAGGSAQVMAKENDYVLLRLPSGELRRVRQECSATVGQVGN